MSTKIFWNAVGKQSFKEWRCFMKYTRNPYLYDGNSAQNN